MLKNLQSYKMWIGSLTHELLSRYLQSLKDLPLDQKKLLLVSSPDSTDSINPAMSDLLQELQNDAISLVIDKTTHEFRLSENKTYDSYDKNQKF